MMLLENNSTPRSDEELQKNMVAELSRRAAAAG